MPSSTTNFSLNKPLVNNATDQDLWGGYLNDNFDTIDTQLLLCRDWKKRNISTTDSVVAGDRHKILLCDATVAAFTLTLLAAATAADGFQVTIVKTDSSANAVTLDGNGAELVGGAATFALSGQGDAAMLVCDGTGWNFMGNKTTPSAVPSASTTAQGIIEIATDTEFRTGVDTVRAITAANVKAGLGFTTYYESAEQTINTNTAVTLSHSLGVLPKFMTAELVCQTADLGYSVGDRVPVSANDAGSNTGLATFYNLTQIGFVYGSAMLFIRKDTGTQGNVTTSSWKVVLRAWA